MYKIDTKRNLHCFVFPCLTDIFVWYICVGKQRWTGVDRQNEAIDTQYNGILQHLGVSAPDGNDFVFFSAPGKSLI